MDDHHPNLVGLTEVERSEAMIRCWLCRSRH